MLLFDAFHDDYRGVICLVQIVVRYDRQSSGL